MITKAALLDIDGTLIDSNRFHAQAWADALQKHGFNIDAASIEPMIGMGGDQIMPRLAGVSKDSEHGKAIAEDRQKIFLKKHLPQIKAFPQAVEFILLLKKDLRLKTILATSANAKELEGLLDQTGLEGLFDGQVTSSDVEASKPAPDVVQAALKKAGVSAEEAFLVGDTPFDLQSARTAGVRMAAVGNGRRKAEDFPGAWLYATDLEALSAAIKERIENTGL